MSFDYHKVFWTAECIG